MQQRMILCHADACSVDTESMVLLDFYTSDILQAALVALVELVVVVDVLVDVELCSALLLLQHQHSGPDVPKCN